MIFGLFRRRDRRPVHCADDHRGSIWGKPTWGVWWTWDARLTLTAILLLIFAGYLMLRSLTEDENRAASAAAVLGSSVFSTFPLIHMSVYWWRTLHQPPSILRPDKAPWDNVHPALLTALAINFVGFMLHTFTCSPSVSDLEK